MSNKVYNFQNFDNDMLDMNVYWLLPEEDSENLRYVVDKFKPLKFHVRGVVENKEKFKKINENLEGKLFDFEQKGKGYLFKVDGEKLFYFEGLKQKSFDVRYHPNNVSLLVTADYEKQEYMEIHFLGKIEVEPTDKERAPGIPFYKIKKS